MKYKTCSKCGEKFPLNEEHFRPRKKSKDGYRNQCRVCMSNHRKKYYQENKEKELENAKIYYQNNKEYYSRIGAEYYQNNKDRILERHSEWEENNKERRKEFHKNYYQRNKDRYRRNAREYQRWFRSTNKGRIINTLRSRLGRVCKGLSDIETTKDLIGCDYENFKEHIENQFTEGMSWDNYGLKGWHLDHIIPISRFDIENEEERKACFHYTNLQPLWAEDNWSKNDKTMDEWICNGITT